MQAVTFLASDEGAFAVGSEFIIDGGTSTLRWTSTREGCPVLSRGIARQRDKIAHGGRPFIAPGGER